MGPLSMEAVLTAAATIAALWLGYRITRAMTHHLGEPEGNPETDEWEEGTGLVSGRWVRKKP